MNKRIPKKNLGSLGFSSFSLRLKLLLFSAMILGWFLIMTSIGIYTIYTINYYSGKTSIEIIPHDKTVHKVIRKLRGADISAYKLAFFDDEDTIDGNYERCSDRLNDSLSMLTALLNGGRIRDISVSTNQEYEVLDLLPMQEEQSVLAVKKTVENVQMLKRLLHEIYKHKLAKETEMMMEKLSGYDVLTKNSIVELFQVSVYATKQYQQHSRNIKETIMLSAVLSLGIFVLSVALMIFYTIIVARNIRQPIQHINTQLIALAKGDIDLSKRLEVTSHDEIGELASNFNKLISNIYDINSFKKVIEEDTAIEDIYKRLLLIFKEDLHLKEFIIYEVSNSQNKMWVKEASWEDSEHILCNRDILVNCNLCRAKKTGKTVSSVEFKNICSQFLETGGKKHICIPMVAEGNPVGVVQFVFGKEEIQCGLEGCLTIAERYLKESIPVIESKRLMETLKQSSLRDPLTGLHNRRFLEEYSEALVSGVLRRKTIIGLLMCDIDFFKQVNDTYGHDIGDIVLREVSQAIKMTIRQSDILVRFGGEEFLVILIDMEQGKTEQQAEEIRRKIEAIKISTNRAILQRTISIGVAEFPVDGENFWHAIKYADVALYKAKASGKNRVVRYSHEAREV